MTVRRMLVNDARVGRILRFWIEVLTLTSILPAPRTEGAPYLCNETSQRGICRHHAFKIDGVDDVFGVLDTAEYRSFSSVQHGFDKQLLERMVTADPSLGRILRLWIGDPRLRGDKLWIEVLTLTSILSAPRTESAPYLCDETSQRGICRHHAFKIHGIDDAFGVLDTAEYWSFSRVQHGFDEQLLVSFFLTLLIRSETYTP